MNSYSSFKYAHISKDWLLNEFKTKSRNKISKELGLDFCVINDRIKQYNIPESVYIKKYNIEKDWLSI